MLPACTGNKLYLFILRFEIWYSTYRTGEGRKGKVVPFLNREGISGK